MKTVYIKQSDLAVQNDRHADIKLCEAVEKTVPGQTIGCQYNKGIWHITFNTHAAKIKLLEKMSTLDIDDHQVELYDVNPLDFETAPSEKIIIKDLPLDVDDQTILDYLRSKSGVVVRSRVVSAHIRDRNNKPTRFLSGDRIIYVKGGFSPVFPEHVSISNNQCRMKHAAQQDACERCHFLGHDSLETDYCSAYNIDHENVVTIRSPKFSLCNYYTCRIKVFDQFFESSEHAYQWRKAQEANQTEYAAQIKKTKSPSDAKRIASRIPSHQLYAWHNKKVAIMEEILMAKVQQCSEFKKTLLSTKGKVITEATRDTFWACGLSPFHAARTKPEFYPGANMLGLLLEKIRSSLEHGNDSKSTSKPEISNHVTHLASSSPHPTADNGNDTVAKPPVIALSAPLPLSTQTTVSEIDTLTTTPDVAPPDPLFTPTAEPMGPPTIDTPLVNQPVNPSISAEIKSVLENKKTDRSLLKPRRHITSTSHDSERSSSVPPKLKTAGNQSNTIDKLWREMTKRKHSPNKDTESGGEKRIQYDEAIK